MLGKASKIKTIELSTNEINPWFQSWPDLEIIAIQYQIYPYNEVNGGGSSALIIYKEDSQ